MQGFFCVQPTRYGTAVKVTKNSLAVRMHTSQELLNPRITADSDLSSRAKSRSESRNFRAPNYSY